MNKEIISTTGSPSAIGPYSQAVKVGNVVYTSGQIPIDPTTNEISGTTAKEQTHMVLKNLDAVVKASGGTLKDVVKTTVFISDMNNFAQINSVYEEYFSNNYPARSCVEVARLPKDVLVEIEAVVYLA